MYLDAINTVNAADDDFTAMSNALGNQLPAVWRAVGQPYANAIDKYDQRLLRINWPTPAITADVKAAVQAASVVAADVVDSTTFQSKLSADNQAWHTASSQVRADLKLPPPS